MYKLYANIWEILFEIQNFKNSKPFELSKYKKKEQIWTKKMF